MKNWQIATLIKSELTAVNVKALTFKLGNWQTPQAGQHYDIRLTAPGGYMAERSYSLASPPEQIGEAEFGIQLLENGEVSPYLWQLKPGEQIEVRGPIGGHFVWEHHMPGPLVLIGGGSGLVPLVSMIRHEAKHFETTKNRPTILLGSFRTLAHVLYHEELKKLAADNPHFKFTITLTDSTAPDWTGYQRRVDEAMLHEVLGELVHQMPMVYVCGPTKFVEVVASLLVKLGINPHLIKTERFG